MKRWEQNAGLPEKSGEADVVCSSPKKLLERHAGHPMVEEETMEISMNLGGNFHKHKHPLVSGMIIEALDINSTSFHLKP